MLVEEGKLKWSTTVAELFPEFAEKMDAGLKGVTLEQLLSHTSGIPSDNATFGKLLEQSATQDGNLDEMRLWLVGQWSKEPLAAKPGTTFAYSNMGYVIAGAMIERTWGKTWEELVTEKVFKPLDLLSAGLGPQSLLGKMDAPFGHELVGTKLKAYLPGPNGDNPLILGPAGTAHMSVVDFAKWAGWNAGRGKRGPHLVKVETMRKLQAPVIEIQEKKGAAPGTPSRRGGYGLGWGEALVEWSPRPLIHHAGSNGKNLAHIWLDADRDVALVMMTNVSGTKADEAFRTLAPELYKRLTKK
jgi:CubicO group peptidase (beta-lactamase class C family)